MAEILTNLKVFIASPSGLDDERKGFRDIINEYNISEANPRHFHFTPVGWEETIGGIGRPQEIINQEVRLCDFMVLVLHDRWGQKPYKDKRRKYTSGTEEEFYVALDAIKSERSPMKDIILFFKAVSERQLSDPGDELKKVLAFRKAREANHDILYETFENVISFQRLLRKYLGGWIRDFENGNRSISKTIGINVKETIYKEKPWNKNNFESYFNYPNDEELLKKAEEEASHGSLINAELLFSQLVVKEQYAFGIARYGNYLRKIGQPDRAQSILNKAINIAIYQKDNETLAYAYRIMGEALHNQGKTTEAVNYYNESINVYKSIDNQFEIAKTLTSLGLLNQKEGNLDEAIKNFNDAYHIYDKGDCIKEKASVFGFIGLIHKNKGDLKEALSFHEKALKIHIDLKDNEGTAIAFGNIGVICRLDRKLDDALKYHKKSLAIYMKLKDSNYGLAREYANIGVVLRQKGEYRKAIEMFEKAIETNEKIGRQYALAIQYGNLGIIYTEEKKFEKAIDYHQKSLSLNEKYGNKKGIAFQYKYLGITYREMANYALAESYFKKAVELNHQLNIKHEYAYSMLELGRNYLLQNLAVQACDWLEKSRRLFLDLEMDYEIKLVAELIKANCK